MRDGPGLRSSPDPCETPRSSAANPPPTIAICGSVNTIPSGARRTRVRRTCPRPPVRVVTGDASSSAAREDGMTLLASPRRRSAAAARADSLLRGRVELGPPAASIDRRLSRPGATLCARPVARGHSKRSGIPCVLVAARNAQRHLRATIRRVRVGFERIPAKRS